MDGLSKTGVDLALVSEEGGGGAGLGGGVGGCDVSSRACLDPLVST